MTEEDQCEILIPIFNGYEAVVRCVESVLRHTSPEHPIALLDDASTDTRLLSWMDRIEAREERVTVYGSNQNLGFVGNVNRGLELSHNDVLLLNSDTVVTDGWLEKLIRCSRTDPAIGIVCPLSNNATILSVPLMNTANEIPEGLGIDGVSSIVAGCSVREYPSLPVAVGFCMLITRATIERVGRLHQAFHLGYGEECDFSLRVWRAGFRVVCCDESFVYHEGEASFGGVASIEAVKQRNHFVLLQRWPDYDRIISNFCKLNPLRELQERVTSALARGLGDERPHVLQVLHSYRALGGTEIHSREITETLAKKFRTSLVFPDATTGWTDISIEDNGDGARVCGFNVDQVESNPSANGNPPPIRDMFVEEKFAGFLRGGRYAVVHFQHLLNWRTLELPLIANKQCVRVILSLHDYFLFCPVYDLMLPEGRPCGKSFADPSDRGCIDCLSVHFKHAEKKFNMAAYLEERKARLIAIMDGADIIVSPSEYVREKFRSAFGDALAKKVRVITHGITKLSPRKTLPRSRYLKLGIVANLSTRKGARIVMELAEELRGSGIKIDHFGGIPTEYRTRLEATGMVFHGPYDLLGLGSLLRKTDLVLVPSIYEETYCLTVSEVQALGVPVIAFKVGAIAERIVDGETGFLVDSPTAGELADRIKAIARTPGILKQVGHRLRNRRQKSITENAAEYAELYTSLCENEPPAELTRQLDADRRTTSHASVKALRLPDSSERERGNAGLGYGTLQYRKWLAWQAESYTSLIDHLQNEPAMNVDVVVTEKNRVGSQLADTLKSLADARGANLNVLIVSYFDPPFTERLGALGWKWERISRDSQLARAQNRWLLAASGDWITWMNSGDRLCPSTFLVLNAGLGKPQPWKYIYTDEDLVAEDGCRYCPVFKPDFNPDYLRSTPYLGAFCLVERQAFIEVGGLAPFRSRSAGLFDLGLRTLDRYGESAIGHISQVLYHRTDVGVTGDLTDGQDEIKQAIQSHLQRNHIAGRVNETGFPRVFWVDYDVSPRSAISIVVTTRSDCDSVREFQENATAIRLSAVCETIVLDFGGRKGSKNELSGCLRSGVKRERAVDPHNIARSLNSVARKAKGDVILFVHDGIRSLTAGALRNLVSLATRSDTGFAAPCILDGNDRILHSYYVTGLGPLGLSSQMHGGQTLGEPGYMDRNICVQNCSVVSDHAFAIRKPVFEAVGGFDAQTFPRICFMLDLGLRLREEGYRSVWTPHSKLHESHEGSLNRHRRTLFRKEDISSELINAYDRWLPQLAKDPGYNRHLSLRSTDWQPEVALGQPWDPSVTDAVRIAGFPDSPWGPGQYRIIEPLRALMEACKASSVIMPFPDEARLPNAVEMARLSPNLLVLHNALDDEHLYGLEVYSRYSDAQMILSLDDLITDLPRSNPFRKTNYPDMLERLQRAVELCGCLLVPTQALADAYSDFCEDIRIVPNYLSARRWQGVETVPRQSGRPRVGWAGAMQHQADLEWLLPVVEELADEVDWYFLGMCPESLRKFTRRYFSMVDFADYPAKLASLQLDVAIAPLESNDFNRCKTNIKVLEYGILGIPTLCSDLEPYLGAPVERLNNDPLLWVKALRDRVRDPIAAAEEGRRLRTWVEEHWLLEKQIDVWATGLGIGPIKDSEKSV